MKRNLISICLVFWWLITFVPTLSAQTTDCDYIWKQGFIGTGIGENSMHSGDYDSDGRMEIICSAGGVWQYPFYWYKLEYEPETESYQQVWISRIYDTETELITVIEVLDAEGDGSPEILVGHDGAIIEMYDAATMQSKGSITIPVTDMDYNLTRLLLADADNDGTNELVCCTRNTTYLLDCNGYGVESKIAYGSHDMRCGNVDTDPLLELVYSDGRVLRVEPGNPEPVKVWQFGTPVSTYQAGIFLSDIDADGMEEILYSNNDLYVYDADQQLLKFSILSNYYEIYAVLVAETGDGLGKEIILGYGDNSIIICDTNGVQIRSILNRAQGVTEFNAGDFDSDGQTELMWGTGNVSTEADFLCVYDLSAHDYEWVSEAFNSPFSDVVVSDVDKDGRMEIVTLSQETNSSYASGGIITAFDAETHQLEWQTNCNLMPYFIGQTRDFEVFDIDNDDINEILIAGDISYDPCLWVINANTQMMESQIFFESWIDRFDAIEIADLDNNGTSEIITASFSHVYIIEPVDYSIQWTSPEWQYGYDGYNDLLTGNIDEDTNPEIVRLSNGLIISYDGITMEPIQVEGDRYSAICLFDFDKNGIKDIIAGTFGGKICTTNSQNAGVEWFPAQFEGSIDGISVFNIPGVESPVFAVMIGGTLFFSDIYGNTFPQVILGDQYNENAVIKTSDYNNDGLKEVFVVSDETVTQFDAACYATVGEDDHIKTGNFTIYPNPATDILYLELESYESGKNAFMELFSMQGVRVTQQALSNRRTAVNIRDLAKGMYILKVTTDDLQAVTKIVKD